MLISDNFTGFKPYLSNTLGAAPVSLGHVLQRRDQAEGVVAVVTAVTQQETVLLIAPSTHQAEVEVDLGDQRHKTHRGGHTQSFPRYTKHQPLEHNELALTKLTSRVSLRGLILMAKAWALR